MVDIFHKTTETNNRKNVENFNYAYKCYINQLLRLSLLYSDSFTKKMASNHENIQLYSENEIYNEFEKIKRKTSFLISYQKNENYILSRTVSIIINPLFYLLNFKYISYLLIKEHSEFWRKIKALYRIDKNLKSGSYLSAYKYLGYFINSENNQEDLEIYKIYFSEFQKKLEVVIKEKMRHDLLDNYFIKI